MVNFKANDLLYIPKVWHHFITLSLRSLRESSCGLYFPITLRTMQFLCLGWFGLRFGMIMHKLIILEPLESHSVFYVSVCVCFMVILFC